jgi:hypothetical protein
MALPDRPASLATEAVKTSCLAALQRAEREVSVK